MSKKVLILKNTGATLYQTPDAKRPSALELGRTLFGGRGTGKLNRLAAAAGLAGKGAALGGTAVQTAHQMQGGNLFAPLSAGYTYEGLDPSGKLLAGRVEAGKQGAEKFQSQQNQIPQSSLAERMKGHTTGSSVGVTPPIPAMPQPSNGTPTAVPQSTVSGVAQSFTGQQNQTGPIMQTHQGQQGVSPTQVETTGTHFANTLGNQPQTLSGTALPQQSSTVQSSLNDYTGQQNTQQFNLQQPFNPSMLNQNQFPTPPPHSTFNPSSSLDPNMLQQPQYNQLDINALDAQKRLKRQMTKAYIKKLYDEFGGYLYKMTPHEAGQFAVYTMFTLRK